MWGQAEVLEEGFWGRKEREWAGAEISLEDKFKLTSNTKAFLQAVRFTAVEVFVSMFKAK